MYSEYFRSGRKRCLHACLPACLEACLSAYPLILRGKQSWLGKGASFHVYVVGMHIHVMFFGCLKSTRTRKNQPSTSAAVSAPGLRCPFARCKISNDKTS